MMYSQKSSAGRKMRVLALVPAIALALAVCNIPAIASTISATSEVKVSTTSASEISANKVSENSVATQTTSNDKVATTVEEMPQYPGGEMAMMEYLMRNVKYPKEAAAANKEGKVVVKFVVEVDGSIGDIEVVRSVDPLLDAETVRVVKAMPRWTPGRSNGQAVACTYTLPVYFKLPPEKEATK